MSSNFLNATKPVQRCLFLVGAWGLVVAFGWLPAWADETTATPIDYLRDIRPIFAEHCSSCHGPEEQESGLRLDDRENLLVGGDWGDPTIVPGKSDESFLIRVVSGEEPDLKMPPEDEPLTATQIELLRTWIDQGASMPKHDASKHPQHWSLRPIAVVEPPAIDDPWIANPIDAFVLTRLREAGLEPSSRAEPRVLTRRTFLTLHGLPPAQKTLKQDSGTHAELVDHLLRSPRYGERWAQHWLDVIRWAETTGYETNLARPRAWPYRDWLIQALNDDMPYDQFIFEQLAGDTIGIDAALGFLVAGPVNLPGQIGKDEESMRQARQDALDEVIRTVSGSFLGLTMGCARCHSHKFDPIPQRDYYAFQAIFAGIQYGERRLRGEENDRWTAEAEKVKEKLDVARNGLEALRRELKLLPPLSPNNHTEFFEPMLADTVRMEIQSTNHSGRPTLFELEIWSAGETTSKNVALATNGGQATASSFALENQSRHPDNLIDGILRTGDRFPWIANSAGAGWIEIKLAQAETINRIVWQRAEEFPVDYDIKVRSPNGDWTTVAHPRNRMLHPEDTRPADKVTLEGVDETDVENLVAQLANARKLNGEYNRLAAGPQVFAGVSRPAEPSYRLKRGDPMQRMEQVEPNVPGVLGSIGVAPGADESVRRVALARHLANPENPLTARVMVNRIWQHHFGAGLVRTPSDMGKMGEEPTHPELLDWLANEFVRSGWSVKALHRLILSSSTFCQSHQPRPEALSVDADCHMLWRFPPRRLEAEVLRDSILQVSGKLNLDASGPGFDFFNQSGGLSDYVPKEEFDESGWRRMIYAKKIRMQQIDVFGAFDCPDAGQMTAKRSRSITPIQALNLLNSTFVNRQAGFFAERVRALSSGDPAELVSRAVELALGRPPTKAETRQLASLCEQHGLEQVARVLFNTNEFVFLP
ncbi:MAG: DUF1553 domain-containing protein [Planctomycetes bacterium]|nr:DUF1553 domain-containing protein [Planctomycetota bacterium]